MTVHARNAARSVFLLRSFSLNTAKVINLQSRLTRLLASSRKQDKEAGYKRHSAQRDPKRQSTHLRLRDRLSCDRRTSLTTAGTAASVATAEHFPRRGRGCFPDARFLCRGSLLPAIWLNSGDASILKPWHLTSIETELDK